MDGIHLEYDGYRYPAWAEGIGWLLAMIAISMIPIWAAVTIYRSLGSLQALRWLVQSPASVIALNLRDVLNPSAEWGPALECNRGRPHQSVRSYRWVYLIPRIFRLNFGQTRQPLDSCSTAADQEGHCFVTETSFYHQSTDNPHNRL